MKLNIKRSILIVLFTFIIVLWTCFIIGGFNPYIRMGNVMPGSTNSIGVTCCDDIYYYISGNNIVKMENNEHQEVYEGVENRYITCNSSYVYFLAGGSVKAIDKTGDIINVFEDSAALNGFIGSIYIIDDFLYIGNGNLDNLNLNTGERIRSDIYDSENIYDDYKISRIKNENVTEFIICHIDNNEQVRFLFDGLKENNLLYSPASKLNVIAYLENDYILTRYFDSNCVIKRNLNGEAECVVDYGKLYEKDVQEVITYMSDGKLVGLVTNYNNNSLKAKLCIRPRRRPPDTQYDLLSISPTNVYITDVDTNETQLAFKSKSGERILYADTQKVAVLSKEKVTIYDIETNKPIRTIDVEFLKCNGEYKVDVVGHKIFFFNEDGLDKCYGNLVGVVDLE